MAAFLWIGGIGGSGTRAVVAALAAAGMFPGACLNESLDSLPMAAVHDRLLPDYLAGSAIDGGARGRVRSHSAAVAYGWECEYHARIERCSPTNSKRPKRSSKSPKPRSRTKS